MPQLVNPLEIPVALVPARLRFPGHSLTVVTKLTFDLKLDAPAERADEQRFPTAEELDPDNPVSPRYDSDFACFKPRADLLLVGTCYTPGGTPVTAFNVGFAIGRHSRMLRVFGERVWQGALTGTSAFETVSRFLHSEASEPIPFTKKELRWEHAYGGPKDRRNPLGKGHRARVEEDGVWRHRLPEIEDPEALVKSPGDKPTPAGFGPIPRTWHLRQKQLGTYKKNWLETRWPWFPDDFDPAYFNSAPPEQQIEGYLRGDEEIELMHLHREHARYVSRLPGVRTRCFAAVCDDDGNESFSEIPMVLDTLWIDMDSETLVLAWRGNIDVADEDYEEVAALYVTEEPLSAPERPVEDWQAEFENLRTDEDEPPSAPEPIADRETAVETPEEDDLAGDPTLAELNKLAEEALAKSGIDPANPPTFTDEQYAQAIEWGKANLGIDLGALADEDDEEEQDAAAAAPDEDPSKWTRKRVEHSLAEKTPLAGEDLSGLHLAALDFRNVDLSGVNLRETNLTLADFTGANLRSASLFDADLSGANLEGTDLTEADLSGAKLPGAKLAGARGGYANFERADLTDADLNGSEFEDATFFEANLTDGRATDAKFASADFTGGKLTGADFSGSDLTNAVLDGCDAEGLVLTNATLVQLRATEAANLRGAQVQRANAAGSMWDSSDLTGSDFSYADLPGAMMTKTQLDDAILIGANLRQASLRRASLKKAQLNEADLFEANLERADLSDADLTGANLYGAELLDASIDGANTDGANLEGTKLA